MKVRAKNMLNFIEPPKTFDWTFYDKDGKHHTYEGLTPKTFYDMVPYDVNEMVRRIQYNT